MGLVKKAAAEAPAAERRDAERDLAGLLAQLRHTDPEERRRAALDLAGVAEAVPALLVAARTERQRTVRDAVLTTLVAHDSPQVASELAGWLGDDDAARRNAAVVALQAMPAGAASVLDELLVTGDVRVRTLAVMVLSTLAHPGVPDWLEVVVDADPDENVVAAAVDTAQQLEDALAGQLSAVAAARFPGNPYLQFLATLAVGAP